MIYFIRVNDGSGTVKIGYTSGDPQERLRSLQTGNPSELTLVGTRRGSQQDERRLHEMLASKRVKGEWFALDEGDLAWALTCNIAPKRESPNSRPFTTPELFEYLDKDPTQSVLTRVGAMVRDAFTRQHGEPPPSRLHRKSNSSGKHYKATYPPEFFGEALAIASREIMRDSGVPGRLQRNLPLHERDEGAA